MNIETRAFIWGLLLFFAGANLLGNLITKLIDSNWDWAIWHPLAFFVGGYVAASGLEKIKKTTN